MKLLPHLPAFETQDMRPVDIVVMGFVLFGSVALSLVREMSWATIRDRLAVSQLNVAHILAPMPIACNLGLTPLAPRMVAPMALGLGGIGPDAAFKRLRIGLRAGNAFGHVPVEIGGLRLLRHGREAERRQGDRGKQAGLHQGDGGPAPPRAPA